MFAYRLTDPNTLGQVSRWDIPINRWLDVKFEQGLNDRGGAVLGRMTEDLFADGPEISAEEANRTYGLPTLKFDSPIRAERARLMNERKEAELARLAYMESSTHSWFSGKALAGFGAQLVGGMLHPVDMAAMFIPVVGSSVKAGGVAKLGGGVFRQTMAKGLVTREFLAETTRFPQFTAAVIEGTVGNAILEVPLFIQNMRDQAIYGPEDSAVNVLAGGLFAGGVRMGISGLGKALEAAAFVHRRVSSEMKEVMFREAANQFLKDQDIAVHEHVKIDDAVIEARVAFDEAKARQEAESQFAKTQEPEPDTKLQTDNWRKSFAEASDIERKIDWLRAVANNRGAKASEQDMVDVLDLAEQLLDQQEHSRLANTFWDVAHNPASSAATRERAQSLYDQFYAIKPERLDNARQQAIQEYVSKKRAEFEANKGSLVAAERQAEVERQRAQGKILPDEEVTRLVTDDPEKAKAILDEDVATLEKDLTNEAKRRIQEDMTPEEKEAIQRELDDEMAGLEESLYKSREKAIQAAIDCVIENASGIVPSK